jgi:hypothetical protein
VRGPEVRPVLAEQAAELLALLVCAGVDLACVGWLGLLERVAPQQLAVPSVLLEELDRAIRV